MSKKSRRSNRRNRPNRDNYANGSSQEVLGTLYKRQGNNLYTAIVTVEYDTSQSRENIPVDNKAVYISSTDLGNHEIVHGSFLHTIDEAIRPIYRSRRLLSELRGVIPRDIRPLVEYEEPSTGAKIFTLPEEDWANVIIHRQGEILRDALLLSGIYVRTLLEDFSGQGNLDVPIYDYEGQPAGSVKLTEIFNTLEHHRYCVVSGEFIHDIFSRKGPLGSDQLIGSKLKTEELFDAILEFVSRIKVRDFVGVLRKMLIDLSTDSSRHDAISAIQNVHSIAQIIQERATIHGTPSEFAMFFVDQLTADEKRMLDSARNEGKENVGWTKVFGLPHFKIGDHLRDRKMKATLMVNGNDETFEFGWNEFFNELIKAHGDESLVPREVLEKRFEYLDGLGC